jgi:hypothetical protein
MSRRACALTVAVLALCARSARGEAPPLIFAVVVGNNDGLGMMPQLHFADDDALRFYRLAVRIAPERNVALLTELDVETWRRTQLSGTRPPPYLPPTKRRLVQVIDLFKQQIAKARVAQPTRPVHFYFFFSGHGERGYFFLKREGSQLADSAFTGQDLQRAFADSRATLNGLFIDACKSQSLFMVKGRGDDDELGPDFSGLIDKLERSARTAPIGVLTSTVSDKPAGEARDIRGGYFSHVLISGLSGAADANSDGVVRYGELAAFVSFHTRRIAGQRPWFRPPDGRLGTPLVVLQNRGDLLGIMPGAAGHFAIFDARGRNLLLEVHKTDKQWTRLILPPDHYKVLWIKSSTSGLMTQVDLRRGTRNLMAAHFTEHVRLGRDVLPKGSPTSLPDVEDIDDVALASFDPSTSGFDQAFTPRVVSALAAAYHAGGTATTTTSASSDLLGGRHLLSASYGYLSPPVDPIAVGQAVGLGYTYRLASLPLQLGGRALFGFSNHTDLGEARSFRMQRLMLQVEAAVATSFWRRFEVSAGVYVGWQLVLVTSDATTWVEEDGGRTPRRITQLSGDAKGFRAGVQGSLRVALIRGLSLAATVSWGVDVVHQADEEGVTHARAFLRPAVLGQVSYAF